MPDDAPQRLRRAQHPGDRRQAHPAHPQRDEHGPRRRRLRPGHGSAPRPLQHADGPGLPRPPRGVPERDPRALAVARLLEHLQRRGRDQDRARAATGRTTWSRRSPPTAPRCTRPSATRIVARDFPGGLRRGRSRRDLRAHVPGAARRPTTARADAGRSRADLQPRLLHLGGAAGRPVRRLRGPPRPAFWARDAEILAGWDA